MSRDNKHSNRKQFNEDHDEQYDEESPEEQAEYEEQPEDQQTDPAPASTKTGMNREMQIGIAVIAVLAIAVGTLLVKRFSASTDVAVAETEEPASEDASKTVFKKRERLADSTASPTTTLAPGQRRSRALVNSGTSRYADRNAGNSTSDRYANRSTAVSTPEPAATDPFRQGRAAATPAANDRYANRKAAGQRYSATTRQEGSDNPLRRTTSQPSATAGTGSRYSNSGSAKFQLAEPQEATATADSDIPDADALDDASNSGSRYDYAAQYEASSNEDEPPPAGFYRSQPIETAKSEPGAAPAYSSPAAADSTLAENTYLVENDESFWEIAQKLYGNGAYFKALEAYNAHRFPASGTLRTGDLVETPTLAELEQAYPDLCPKLQQAPAPRRVAATTAPRQASGQDRVYVVQEGDTVFDIARYQLGQATRWAEIYELNRDVLGDDVTHLPAGSELRLPNPDRGRVVQRPSGRFR